MSERTWRGFFNDTSKVLRWETEHGLSFLSVRERATLQNTVSLINFFDVRLWVQCVCAVRGPDVEVPQARQTGEGASHFQAGLRPEPVVAAKAESGCWIAN